MWIVAAFGLATQLPSSPTDIFAPVSTPAQSIFELSLLVLAIAAAIFVVVSGLLAYATAKFRKRRDDDGREPAQVYGSTQVELAWTITVQDPPRRPGALEVTVIGHQFWWEYQYPGLKVVTANELHVPVGEPTFLTLLSADTDHSFWVPRLAGKTDLIPNHPNKMWIEPREKGVYVGQCAQYCGTQHAKMLLRVYVEAREDFDRWIKEQAAAAQTNDSSSEGRRVFERTACINCHTVAGTAANGRFGPDLTHLMSRETLGSGVAPHAPDGADRSAAGRSHGVSGEPPMTTEEHSLVDD